MFVNKIPKLLEIFSDFLSNSVLEYPIISLEYFSVEEIYFSNILFTFYQKILFDLW